MMNKRKASADSNARQKAPSRRQSTASVLVKNNNSPRQRISRCEKSPSTRNLHRLEQKVSSRTVQVNKIVDVGIPKTRFSSQDRSREERSSSSPRLKSFPAEQIKKLECPPPFSPNPMAALIVQQNPCETGTLFMPSAPERCNNNGQGDAVVAEQRLHQHRQQRNAHSASQQQVAPHQAVHRLGQLNPNSESVLAQQAMPLHNQVHRPFVPSVPQAPTVHDYSLQKAETVHRISGLPNVVQNSQTGGTRVASTTPQTFVQNHTNGSVAIAEAGKPENQNTKTEDHPNSQTDEERQPVGGRNAVMYQRMAMENKQKELQPPSSTNPDLSNPTVSNPTVQSNCTREYLTSVQDNNHSTHNHVPLCAYRQNNNQQICQQLEHNAAHQQQLQQRAMNQLRMMNTQRLENQANQGNYYNYHPQQGRPFSAQGMFQDVTVNTMQNSGTMGSGEKNVSPHQRDISYGMRQQNAWTSNHPVGDATSMKAQLKGFSVDVVGTDPSQNTVSSQQQSIHQQAVSQFQPQQPARQGVGRQYQQQQPTQQQVGPQFQQQQPARQGAGPQYQQQQPTRQQVGPQFQQQQPARQGAGPQYQQQQPTRQQGDPQFQQQQPAHQAIAPQFRQQQSAYQRIGPQFQQQQPTNQQAGPQFQQQQPTHPQVASQYQQQQSCPQVPPQFQQQQSMYRQPLPNHQQQHPSMMQRPLYRNLDHRNFTHQNQRNATPQNQSNLNQQAIQPSPAARTEGQNEKTGKKKALQFTPDMIRDQELLVSTMRQQGIPDDIMRRQFAAMLSEQRRQLLYLEETKAQEEAPETKRSEVVPRKVKQVDEKPEWMIHITPPRISYTELERLKAGGNRERGEANENQLIQQEKVQQMMPRQETNETSNRQVHSQSVPLPNQQGYQFWQQPNWQQQTGIPPSYDKTYSVPARNAPNETSNPVYNQSVMYQQQQHPNPQNFPYYRNTPHPQQRLYDPQVQQTRDSGQSGQNGEQLRGEHDSNTQKIMSQEDNGRASDPCSLLKMRLYKEVIRPQKRNNGLQDSETARKALEALKSIRSKKGFEYLVNLGKKQSVAKLNGIQDFTADVCDQRQQRPPTESSVQLRKRASANGLENVRNSDNPRQRRMSCSKVPDQELVKEYPRQRQSSSCHCYGMQAERENGTIANQRQELPNEHQEKSNAIPYNEKNPLTARSAVMPFKFHGSHPEYYQQMQQYYRNARNFVKNNGEGDTGNTQLDDAQTKPNATNAGGDASQTSSNEQQIVQNKIVHQPYTAVPEMINYGQPEIHETRTIGGIKYLARKQNYIPNPQMISPETLLASRHLQPATIF